MHKIGIYHPHIHFPSDAWVKTAALYWTKLGRIVPTGCRLRDSDTVRALRDELDFVLDVDPQVSISRSYLACATFRWFIEEHQPWLQPLYGGRSAERSVAAEVADEKFAWTMRHALERTGLATDEGTNLVMHPELARVYMSVLAEDIAKANQLQPVTDDPDLYAVGSGWTPQRMRSVLLPAQAARLNELDRRDELHQAAQMLGMIAVNAVVPRDLHRMPVERIVEIRRRFGPQFLAFRELADSIAAGIEQNLGTVEDPEVLRAYIEQEAQDRLVGPARQLRRDLRLLKIDAGTKALTFKYELPALAALAAGGLFARQPVVAGGAAVAAGLLGVVRSTQLSIADARDNSSVSYLTLLEDELNPRFVVTRALRRVMSLAGPHRAAGPH